MPLSAVDYRSACGQNDYSRNKKTRYSDTQNRLNNIALSQQYKTPEGCSALSMLYLSLLILPSIQRISPGIDAPCKSSAGNDTANNTRVAIEHSAFPINPISTHESLVPLTALPARTSPPRLSGGIFPMAQAAKLPQLDVIQRNDAEGVLIAAGDDGKRLLLNLAKSFLINMGQINLAHIQEIEFEWRQVSASEPIMLAHIELEERMPREKRISMHDRNKMIADHIAEKCAFEAEIYHPDGQKQGELLLFKAQRIDNPFRMLYDNIPGYEPSNLVYYSAKFANYFVDVITLGLKPLYSNLWANYYRKQYYSLLNDKLCEKRQVHISFANIITSVDITSAKNMGTKNTRYLKPLELNNIVPFKSDAPYILHHKNSNIERGIFLTAKSQREIASTPAETMLLKPKGEKEFDAVIQSNDGKKKEKKRVVFNEEDKIWRIADEEDAPPLNLQLESGDSFITLYGEKHRLHYEHNDNLKIIAHDTRGIERLLPVYQNPISNSWHLQQINGHPAYTHVEQKIINKLSVKANSQFRYDATNPLHAEGYSDALIYEVRSSHDALTTTAPIYQVIEMNGAVVPVRTAVMQGRGVRYSIYDLNTPLKSGYRVEWNGERWRIELWTSPYISKALNEQISPTMFATDVPLQHLSPADHRGIQWADGRGFLKIRGQYVEVHEGVITRIGRSDGQQISVQYKEAKFFPLAQNIVRERSRLIASQDVVDKLKSISQDHLKGTPQIMDIEHIVRAMVVKSTVNEAKITSVGDATNSTLIEFRRSNNPASVTVKSVPSNTVEKKRYLVTLNDDDYFFVEISHDGTEVKVLLDDEETLALDKYRNALAGGDILSVAALRHDEEIAMHRAQTRAEIDDTARARIESGALMLREALNKMQEHHPQQNNQDIRGKTLLVANANFLKTAEFENNVFSSPDSAYQAMIDILIPLSKDFPSAIIIPGSVYISQDIPQRLIHGQLQYQLGEHTRKIENIVNLSTVLVPVLYNGKFVVMPRKGEYLSYKKKNAPEESPALKLKDMDEVPWGATLVEQSTQGNPHSDLAGLDDARVGTIFVGKTLFPGERTKADWFFCPCPESNGTRNIDNFFSNEFIIDGDKFLLVVEDEFIQHGSERPAVRKRAYPQEENIPDANRYDWIIHCAAGDALDTTMQSAGYNYLEANTVEGAEYASEITQRLHLVSYLPEKKLTLYEFFKN